jgi:hypothetical protein
LAPVIVSTVLYMLAWKFSQNVLYTVFFNFFFVLDYHSCYLRYRHCILQRLWDGYRYTFLVLLWVSDFILLLFVWAVWARQCRYPVWLTRFFGIMWMPITIPYPTIPYHDATPYYSVLYYHTIRYTIPYYTIIKYHHFPHQVPYHTTLHFTSSPHPTIEHHTTIPYWTSPHHTIPYHTVLYHTMVWYGLVNGVVPYHIISNYITPYLNMLNSI